MQLPAQWHELSKSDASIAEAELYMEAIPGHKLYGISATAIARRKDRDDFLFKINDDSKRIAIVHITWKGAPELSTIWPMTEVGCDLNEVLTKLYPDEMLPLRCPCCYSPTLTTRGGFEMCSKCGWEDDGQDDHDADIVYGGPNGNLSLTEARMIYARITQPPKT